MSVRTVNDLPIELRSIWAHVPEEMIQRWIDEPDYRECGNAPTKHWVKTPGGYILKDKSEKTPDLAEWVARWKQMEEEGE